MSAQGSIFKRCSCTTETTGGRRKKLGSKCPKLRRPDGVWLAHHGTWAYQLELPLDAQGDRRQLKRTPAIEPNTRDAAADELDAARALMSLGKGDPRIADEIATMLKALPAGQPLPDYHDIARRVRAGASATATETLAEYLTRWITHRAMDENTRRGYAGHIRNHLIPHLGHIALEKLKVTDVEAMFTAIAKHNNHIRTCKASKNRKTRLSVKGQRITSLATMHNIRATLRKALNDAIRKDRILEFNAAAYAELLPAPKPKAKLWTDAAVAQWEKTGKIPSPVMVWQAKHAGAFLDYAEEHEPDLYAMFAFILRRGPRRGEAVGIAAEQIELSLQPQAVITHQITPVGYDPIYKTVKTRNGDRTISIDPDTVADLLTYLVRRAEVQDKLSDQWPETLTLVTPAPEGDGFTTVEVDLFFRRPDGQAWHPNQVSEIFERLVREAGLPPITIHDARHCAATFTHAAGGDLHAIKELLGHSTIAITSDIYLSLLTEYEQELARKTAALIPRKNRQPTPD